jgi:acyl-CoA reductase-like NAD-dependent aldehyde dehydrogenase
VLDRVTPEMTVVRRETFGPVSPVIRFKTVEEAIRISNGTALRPVVLALHQSPRPDHALRAESCNVGSVNVREVPGYRLGDDAVRRHQGLGARIQGRGTGSHEELLQYEDLFTALVNRGSHDGTDSADARPS